MCIVGVIDERESCAVLGILSPAGVHRSAQRDYFLFINKETETRLAAALIIS